MHSTTDTWLYRPHPDAPDIRRAGDWLGSLRRDSAHGKRIAIEHADSTWIDGYTGRAAAPSVATCDLGHAWRLEIDAPGATAKNTSVVWDASRQALVVAVWCGARPARRQGHFPQPEVAWFRGFELPTADFNRADARVRRGLIIVEAPQRAARRASWEPATPASSRASDAPRR
jgi:hypothetical protein